MKNPLILILVLSCLGLGGCAQPALVVGQTSAIIDSGDVVIYYAERPRCNFETIAHLRAIGGYYSLDSMFRNMRRQAAELGATGLYVLHTQQLALKEYLGTAKAIRCLPT